MRFNSGSLKTIPNTPRTTVTSTPYVLRALLKSPEFLISCKG